MMIITLLLKKGNKTMIKWYSQMLYISAYRVKCSRTEGRWWWLDTWCNSWAWLWRPLQQLLQDKGDENGMYYHKKTATSKVYPIWAADYLHEELSKRIHHSNKLNDLIDKYSTLYGNKEHVELDTYNSKTNDKMREENMTSTSKQTGNEQSTPVIIKHWSPLW